MRSRSFAFALPFALGLCAADANAARHFFSATIDGAQETPPNGSPATGSGSFVLDTTAGTASFNVTFSGLPTAEVASHVHVAPPGVPGGIVYGLPAGSPKIGVSPVLTPVQQDDMLDGNHYVNIHSITFPAGEIRGQILPTGDVEQYLPTKLLIVKNPGPATSRKIIYKVKELAPNASEVEGDPIADGAKLKVKLDGNTQCFNLPAGANWSAISTIGYKYKDPSFTNGPVKVAIIKKAPSGVFLVKTIIMSTVHPITVVPPNPGVQADTNFTIGSEKQYCGSSAGGTINPNSDKTFKVKASPAPAGCGVTPCSPSGAFLDPLAD